MPTRVSYAGALRQVLPSAAPTLSGWCGSRRAGPGIPAPPAPVGRLRREVAACSSPACRGRRVDRGDEPTPVLQPQARPTGVARRVLLRAPRRAAPATRELDSDLVERPNRTGACSARRADDKAGVTVRLAALRRRGDRLPGCARYAVLVEGEEEVGSAGRCRVPGGLPGAGSAPTSVVCSPTRRTGPRTPRR